MRYGINKNTIDKKFLTDLTREGCVPAFCLMDFQAGNNFQEKLVLACKTKGNTTFSKTMAPKLLVLKTKRKRGPFKLEPEQHYF